MILTFWGLKPSQLLIEFTHRGLGFFGVFDLHLIHHLLQVPQVQKPNLIKCGSPDSREETAGDLKEHHVLCPPYVWRCFPSLWATDTWGFGWWVWGLGWVWVCIFSRYQR